jgi:hypothetical protein
MVICYTTPAAGVAFAKVGQKLEVNVVRTYCRAYHLHDLQEFSGWKNQLDADEDLTGDSIVYLWDDLTVVKSPVQSGGVLYQEVTPEWQDFCANVLHFAIPDDLRYAYEQEAAPPASDGSPTTE